MENWEYFNQTGLIYGIEDTDKQMNQKKIKTYGIPLAGTGLCISWEEVIVYQKISVLIWEIYDLFLAIDSVYYYVYEVFCLKFIKQNYKILQTNKSGLAALFEVFLFSISSLYFCAVGV